MKGTHWYRDGVYDVVSDQNLLPVDMLIAMIILAHLSLSLPLQRVQLQARLLPVHEVLIPANERRNDVTEISRGN